MLISYCHAMRACWPTPANASVPSSNTRRWAAGSKSPCATWKFPALESLRRELRDRFGPLPRAMDLLLHVAELKILASERGIAAIETKEDRLMLTRNNDYITLAGKFPRLTKQEPKARLNEVRKLLLAL